MKVSTKEQHIINEQVNVLYPLLKTELDKCLQQSHHVVDDEVFKRKIVYHFVDELCYSKINSSQFAPQKYIKISCQCVNCGKNVDMKYHFENKSVEFYRLALQNKMTIVHEPITECKFNSSYDIDLDVTSGEVFISDWLRLGNTELSTLLGFNQFEDKEFDQGRLASELLYNKYKPYKIVSIHGSFPKLYRGLQHDLMFGTFSEELDKHCTYLDSDRYRNLLIVDIDTIKQLIDNQLRAYMNNPPDFNADKIFTEFKKEHKKNIISVPKGTYKGKAHITDVPTYKGSYVLSFFNKEK